MLYERDKSDILFYYIKHYSLFNVNLVVHSRRSVLAGKVHFGYASTFHGFTQVYICFVYSPSKVA